MGKKGKKGKYWTLNWIVPAALSILTRMITILKEGRPRRRPAIPLIKYIQNLFIYTFFKIILSNSNSKRKTFYTNISDFPFFPFSLFSPFLKKYIKFHSLRKSLQKGEKREKGKSPNSQLNSACGAVRPCLEWSWFYKRVGSAAGLRSR